MTNKEEIRRIIGYTHEKQKANHEIWLRLAQSYNEATAILNENQDRLGGTFIIHFNMGLSLELLLKAVLAAKEETLKETHQLRELASLVGIALSEDQLCTLDYLSECIIWSGRYPVPKKEDYWNNFHDKVCDKLEVREGNLVRAHSARFPTMKNYTTIWELAISELKAVENAKCKA